MFIVPCERDMQLLMNKDDCKIKEEKSAQMEYLTVSTPVKVDSQKSWQMIPKSKSSTTSLQSNLKMNK